MRKLSWLLAFIVIEGFMIAFFANRVQEVEYHLHGQVESLNLKQLDVLYDTGDNWTLLQRHSIRIEKPKQGIEFSFMPNAAPRRIRLDFGTDADTLVLSGVYISNSVGDVYTFDEHIIEKQDIELFEFRENGELDMITVANDAFIVLDTKSSLEYWRHLHTFPIWFWLISIILNLGIIFLLGDKIIRRIHVEHSLLVGFVIIITFSILNTTTGLIPYPEVKENRKLAKFPTGEEWLNNSMDQMLNQTESFLNDHFSLRPRLAFIHAYINYYLFNCSSNPRDVLVGEAGYLFPVQLGILQDFKHEIFLPPHERNYAMQTIQERRRWLESQGIPFIVVFIPNKHTIYPEYMNKAIVPGSGANRMGQILSFFKANFDTTYVDLTEVLMQAKAAGQGPLFYKNDMHWNNYGAFLGYQRIMDEASKYYPELKPWTFNDFDTSASYHDNGDLARILLLSEYLPKKEVDFIPKKPVTKFSYSCGSASMSCEIWAAPKKELKLVMFRDSYTVNLVPFISNHFQRSVFVWDHHFDHELILREKPDLVILEVAELFMGNLMFGNPDAIKTEESNI